MWKGVDVVSTHLEPGHRSGYMVFPVGGRRGFARPPAGRRGQDGAGNEGKDGAGRLYDKARCGGRIKNGGVERKSRGLLRKSGGLSAESPPLFASPSACAAAWRTTVRSVLSRGSSSRGRSSIHQPMRRANSDPWCVGTVRFPRYAYSARRESGAAGLKRGIVRVWGRKK